MSTKGKRFNEAQKLIDPNRAYPVAEAVKLAKETSKVKFDATVELHLRLGIDPKKAEHTVRSTVVLPHASGKTRTVAAFVAPNREKEARDAGADIVGGDELVKEIQATGKIAFDVAVTTPDFMKNLARVARILGPKGLMPNPKSETITTNLAKTLEELKKGKQTFRSDATGNVHLTVGRVSLSEDQLRENIEAGLDAVKKAKPQDLKGTYLKTITLSTTMGPAIGMKA